jgi:hypothetical protein
MGTELHPKSLSLTSASCYQPLYESIAKCCKIEKWLLVTSRIRKLVTRGRAPVVSTWEAT